MVHHHHHELTACRRAARRLGLRKIFILIAIIGHMLLVNLSNKCVSAGSKSKEKSTKTTVIAISGQGGKAHPVPMPWPVVHCHHHHHHLKYVPKPVLVHHWVKKYKPVDIEASNQHYQVLEGPMAARGKNQQQSRFMASSPHSNYQMAPQNIFRNEHMSAAGGQLMPLSLFSQADRNKLPYDLMDGSQLVSALSNAFDPLVNPLAKPPPPHPAGLSQLLGDSQEATMDERELNHSSTPKYELLDKEQLAPYKAAHNQTQSSGVQEIEKEFNKFDHEHRQQQQKRLRSASDGHQRVQSGKPSVQFTDRQLEKLTKSIKSAQKQLKSPTFDTEPFDSFKNNVIAADIPTPPGGDSNVGQQQEEVGSSATSSGASALANLPAGAAGKPSHPFDEPQDQLRDESRTESDQEIVVANRFGSHLNQANLREEAQARRALDQVAFEQENRLAALNVFDGGRQVPPVASALHANAMSPKLHPLNPPLLTPANLAAGTMQLMSPAAVSARMASVLSESHAINLMTRLAERMAQLEAKNLLDRQMAKTKVGANKAQPSAATNKSSTARSFFGNFDQVRSLLSPLRGSRERRRQSKAKKLVQTSEGDAHWVTTTSNLQPQASSVKKFVWTTQGNLKPTSTPSIQTAMIAATAADYRAPTSPAAQSAFMSNDPITASPLNLSFLQHLDNTVNAHTQAASIIHGRPANPAASSRFISHRLVGAERQQLPATKEGLASEGSVLVKKIVEPATAKQQMSKTRVFGHKSNAADRSAAPPTTTVEPARLVLNSSQPAQVMSVEQESRFYVGQHEHLEKAKQQEGQQNAAQASQLSLDLHPPQDQAIQVRQLPIARGTRQQQQQPVESNLVDVAGIKATNTNRLYSSQSSNVRQSVLPPTQQQQQQQNLHEPAMPTAEMGAEALRELESMQANGQMKSFPFQMQASNGADVSTEQPAHSMQVEPQELQLAQPQQQQQQTQGQFQMASQLPSYLEFPMSPEQWSAEAMKSLNGQQQQPQDQQQPQSEASQNQDQTGSSQQDEQQSSSDQPKANENQEAGEPDNNQQNQASSQNELSPFELMSADPAAAYQLMAGQQQQQNQQAPLLLNPAMMAPSLQQASFQQPQPANPYGYYTAGQQQEAMSASNNLLGQLEGSFGPYASLLGGSSEQSQFTTNYNPMTQQPYSKPAGGGLSWAGSNLMLSGVPPTVGDYNLARFPQMTPKSAAKLAAKMQTLGGINQSASLLSNSFAGPMNNMTGLGGLAGTLGNQMQARLPPQMPQIPNIPQPPQLPNLPMPPPGMLQMAASMALPLAMARATRNSNRFRNNQVNSAATNGGSTANTGTTAGQRFLRNVSSVTNRLMRSRRQPSTSRPAVGRPLTHRRQPFVWGRPNGSGSLGSSGSFSGSSGINISRRRPPLTRFIQTVVDMSRRPPLQMAANLAGSAVLSAAKASVATSISPNLARPSRSALSSSAAASSAAGSVANAAASAVAQAAGAVAADKIKPKIDTENTMRRGDHASRLSRSLERLQHDLREAGKQRPPAASPAAAQSTGGSVVMPGLPRIALTDGSLATFGSMTSPVDLLHRQLATQRKVRELTRQPYFHLSSFEEHPLAHQAQYELMRLNALTSAATRPQISVPRTTHAQSASSNYELIPSHSLQSLEDPSQTPLPIQQTFQRVQPAPKAHYMNATHPVPYVANHFNLLMFTTQNVTGNLGLKVAQQSQEQQSTESAAALQAEQNSAEQANSFNQQVPPLEQQQLFVSPSTRHQATDLARSGEDKQRRQQSSEVAIKRVVSELEDERDQLREETTRRPVAEQKSHKLDPQDGLVVLEISGNQRPEKTDAKPETDPTQAQETQVKAKRSKRKKSHPHGYSTSTQAPHQLSSSSPVTTTGTTPSPTTVMPTTPQRLAGDVGHNKSQAHQDVQHVSSESQWSQVSATKMVPIRANKMELWQQHSRSKPTTSVRPTRAAVLAVDESLSEHEQPVLRWKSVNTQLAAEETLDKGTLIETTKMPAQIEMLTSQEEPLASTSFETENGATTATPATGDYVRAIKLVRGLAYPWPPPTQSAKMLT